MINDLLDVYLVSPALHIVYRVEQILALHLEVAGMLKEVANPILRQ